MSTPYSSTPVIHMGGVPGLSGHSLLLEGNTPWKDAPNTAEYSTNLVETTAVAL